MRIKSFMQGEGAFNPLSELARDSCQGGRGQGNVTVSTTSILIDDQVRNWNGDVSPVVQGLGRFVRGGSDDLLRRLNATRCLIGCESSPRFDNK